VFEDRSRVEDALLDVDDADAVNPSRSERSVLVVFHQDHSSAGRIGTYLREQGCRFDVRRPRYGDPLPRSMADHDAAIVFGGPMSANDDEEYIRREIDWIGLPLAANKPFLGICLGAQMLARHLGHRVAPHPEGRVEVGFCPIRPTAAGSMLWPDAFPKKVYQWHREGFDLPVGATLLAEGDDFRAQAFRYGPSAYGLQFHPEVTYQMMCRWTTAGEEKLALPGARERERHFRDWYIYDAAIAFWLKRFLHGWLDSGGARREGCARRVTLGRT
jgi:GMP synthase (glutamine-hydrolysing)